MSNNISSTIPLVDIVLIIAGLSAVFIAIYLILNFIKQNPHILAWAGLVALVFGGACFLVDELELVGGAVMLGGALAFLLAAIISSAARSNADKAMVAKSYKKLVQS